GALLQAPGHDDAGAARERLGGVLREVAPDVDPEERRVTVRPVPRGVADPRAVRDREVRHRGPVRRVAQLRVVGDVAYDRDLVVARHCGVTSLGARSGRQAGAGEEAVFSSRCVCFFAGRSRTLYRMTSSARFRTRSSSAWTEGSAVKFTTA